MKKIILFSLLFVAHFRILKAQTDSLVIFKYNSLTEWEGDKKFKESFIDKHLTGGNEFFLKTITKNFNNFNAGNNLCSTGIILFSLHFKNDSVILVFANDFWKVEQEGLVKSFRTLDSLWVNLPKEKYSLNFSIAYNIEFNGAKVFGEYGEHDSFIQSNSNKIVCLSDDNGSSECRFKDNQTIIAHVEFLIEQKDYKPALFLLKELMRRQPFNKDYYNEYYQLLVLEKNKN